MHEVDSTIKSICNWIEEELKKDERIECLAEMIKALAELISARAGAE